jgi:hypothetical protein
MPFTPFHFGPGLLMKAAAPRRFSFLSFATTQVAIDLESLHYLTAGDQHVHRTLHTMAAGGLAGVAVGALTWGIGAGVHAAIGSRVGGMSIGTPIPIFGSELSGRGALLGGVLGGLSHSLLDAIVHSDVQPFLPFAPGNPFLGLIEWNTMETACIAAGVVGLFGILARMRAGRVA